MVVKVTTVIGAAIMGLPMTARVGLLHLLRWLTAKRFRASLFWRSSWSLVWRVASAFAAMVPVTGRCTADRAECQSAELCVCRVDQIGKCTVRRLTVDDDKWRKLGQFTNRHEKPTNFGAVACRFILGRCSSARSLRLDARRPDHLGPFLSVLDDQLVELGGRGNEHCTG
jgi:hypothetical protein